MSKKSFIDTGLCNVLSDILILVSVKKLVEKIKATIKTQCSPRHVPAKIIQIADIPYTINNKKVEIAIKNIINGKEVKNSHVLRNPESLELYKNLAELVD